MQHRHRLHRIRADDDERADAAQALPQRLADIDILDAPQRDVIDAGADESLLDGQPAGRERILELLQAHEADEPQHDGDPRQGDQQDPFIGEGLAEMPEREQCRRAAQGDEEAAQDGARVLALARRRRPQQAVLVQRRRCAPLDRRDGRWRRARGPTRRCTAAGAESGQGGDLLAAFAAGDEGHGRLMQGRPRRPSRCTWSIIAHLRTTPTRMPPESIGSERRRARHRRCPLRCARSRPLLPYLAEDGRAR